MNYFEFYGLSVKFHLDETDLRKRYFNLLKTNHPDFHINNPLKYEESLLSSSINNEAYKCLSDFYARANYILSLKYLDFEETLPPAFLMEMMEINEEIEHLKSTDREKIADILNNVALIEKSIHDDLYLNSKKADHLEIEDEHILKAIKIGLLKHKYILRLKETLANIAAL
jgi:molecular chaperone HscB